MFPPPIYDYPPLFTLQPNLDTRQKQIDTWISILLNYAQENKRTTWTLSSEGVFTNPKISRSLDSSFILLLYHELVKRNLAEWKKDSKNSVLFLYYKTPDEWATILYQYIIDTGQTNSVLTLFELLQGDDTLNQEFHGLDSDFFKSKILDVLVKSGKATLLSASDENEIGIKFF